MRRAPPRYDLFRPGSPRPAARAALAALALAVLGGSPPVAPAAPAADQGPQAAPLKKGSPAYKRRVRPRRAPRRAARPGDKPRPVINVIHLHTGERLAVDGVPSRRDIDRFLRCRWTHQQRRMDPRPFRWMLQAARHFGVDEIHVISGYRHPKFNDMLWKKGRQVARRSKHRLGQALDFRLVGVSVEAAFRYLVKRRLGGVGRYPDSRFLHLDTGPVRTWGGT